MKRLSYLIMIFIGIILSGIAHAKELVIGFAPEKPPFVFAAKPFSEKYYDLNPKEPGIQIDIVSAALKGSEYTFRPYYAPNTRIIVNVRNRMFDAGEMAGPADPDLFYSDSIIAFTNYAITRKSEHLKIDRIEDLKGLQMVAWQGAINDLGDKFFAIVDGNPNYHENPSLRNQCAMFFAGRVQVIIIDKSIFLWWKKQLSGNFNTRDELVFHPIFPGTNHYRMGFWSKKVRDVFEEGLQRIKKNGTYEQIYRDYLE